MIPFKSIIPNTAWVLWFLALLWRRRSYIRQCAAVKIHLSPMSDPPHIKFPFTLSVTCHGQAPRAAHWPLTMYGVMSLMFGDRWPHPAWNTPIPVSCTLLNIATCNGHLLAWVKELRYLGIYIVSSRFLQRVSIACCAERCISYDKVQ